METTEPRIAPAVSVAMLNGRSILLVRRGRAPSKGLYAFPGGRVEPGESLEDAARRELMEETGLAAGDLSLFQTVDIPAERDGEHLIYRLSVFRAGYIGGEPRAGDDADLARWFSLDDLAAIPLTESTMAAALALLSRAGRANAFTAR